MELPCLVSTNSAYDVGLSSFPRTVRRTTEEKRKFQIQSNDAYSSSSDYRPSPVPKPRTESRQANHAHAQDWDRSATSRAVNDAIYSEPISLHDNANTTPGSKRPTSLRSSTTGRSSIAFRRRKAKGKERKCRDVTFDATIAFVAMFSIVLSGTLIVVSITCELFVVPSRNIYSSDENNITVCDQSELTGNNLLYIRVQVCVLCIKIWCMNVLLYVYTFTPLS